MVATTSMVATTPNNHWDIPIGIPVLTADGSRFGSVIDGDAYQLVIGQGFLFRRHYAVMLADVQRYEEGSPVLKWSCETVEERCRMH